MTSPTQPQSDTCHNSLSINQTVVKMVARVTFVLCLDHTLSQLEEDDSVSVSVGLLRKLRDGTA